MAVLDDWSEHPTCIDVVTTPSGDPAWHVTCHSLVTRLLADGRLAASRPKGLPASTYYASNQVGPLLLLPDADEASHRASRNAVRQLQTKETRRLVESVAEDAVRAAIGRTRADGLIDFHSEISVPLPVMVTCRLLEMSQHVDRIGQLVWAAEESLGSRGAKDSAGQLTTLARERLMSARESCSSRLLSDLVRYASLTDDEAATHVITTLLQAGTLALTQALDHGLVMLLTNDNLRLAFDYSREGAARSIDEMLRCEVFDPARRSRRPRGILRYVHTPFVIEDAEFEVGDLVIIDQHAANYDSAVFPSPETIDTGREYRRHRSFGHGSRRCPGGSIATTALAVVFASLLRFAPAARLATTSAEILSEVQADGGQIRRLIVQFA